VEEKEDSEIKDIDKININIDIERKSLSILKRPSLMWIRIDIEPEQNENEETVVEPVESRGSIGEPDETFIDFIKGTVGDGEDEKKGEGEKRKGFMNFLFENFSDSGYGSGSGSGSSTDLEYGSGSGSSTDLEYGSGSGSSTDLEYGYGSGEGQILNS